MKTVYTHLLEYCRSMIVRLLMMGVVLRGMMQVYGREMRSALTDGGGGVGLEQDDVY